MVARTKELAGTEQEKKGRTWLCVCVCGKKKMGWASGTGFAAQFGHHFQKLNDGNSMKME